MTTMIQAALDEIRWETESINTAVLRLLADGKPRTTAMLATELAYARSSVVRAVGELVAEGKIRKGVGVCGGRRVPVYGAVEEKGKKK